MSRHDMIYNRHIPNMQTPTDIKNRGGFVVGIAERLGVRRRDERLPNLTSQALERSIDMLEFAEVSGFPDMKMDMLKHVTTLTANSLQPDGTPSKRPFTDHPTVARGVETVHDHYPHLLGIDENEWLNEDQYKALWQAVQRLPQPYEPGWQPEL